MSRLVEKLGYGGIVAAALFVGGGSLAVAASAFLGSPASASPTCTIYWTGHTSTAWGIKTNWSLTNGGPAASRLPATTDFVCMSTSPTTSTVLLTTTSVVGGINFSPAGAVNPNLTIDGSLQLGNNTVIDPSALDQVDDEGSLIAFGTEAATAANLTLNGTLQGPGSLTVTGPTTLSATSTSSLGVSGDTTTAAHLITQGATTVASTNANYVYLQGGSTLENQGALTLTDNSVIYNADGTAGNQLINDPTGTITYTGTTPTDVADINVAATNNGTVTAASGTLDFGDTTNGVTDTGTYTATTGATLDVAGTRTESSGATIAGNGTVDITGTTTYSAADNLTNTGTLQVDGTLAVNTGTNVTAANLTLNGTLQGPGSLTVTGPTTLSATSTSSLGVSGDTTTAAHLITQGATTVASTNANYVYLQGGSTLENQGALTLTDNSVIYNADGTAGNQLINDPTGTITYTGTTPTDVADINVAATNNGTVTAASGTLDFGDTTNGVTDTGTYTATTGATLDVAGTRTESSGATIAGNGTVDITGTTTYSAADNLTNTGTLQVDGTLAVNTGTNVTAANLTLNGTLQGPGSLTVTGPTTLSATSTSSLGVSGDTTTAAHLITQGATTVASTNANYVYLQGGSTLENQGALTLTDNSVIYNADGTAGNQLINDPTGTITYTGTTPTDVADINVAATNNGTVTAASGTLDFGDTTNGVTDTGTYTATTGATLDVAGTRTESSGATIAGNGTVDITGTTTYSAADNLTNTGTLQVDGTLAVNTGTNVTAANLTLNGTLQGPGSLTVTGPTTLSATSTSSLGVSGDTTTAAHLITQGATTVASTNANYVYLQGGSTLENQGALTLTDNSVIYNADGTAGNQLINDPTGTITYTGSKASQSAEINVLLINNGSVVAGLGTLTVDNLANLSGSKLTGGSYTATGGTLSLPAKFTTNAASVTIGATGVISSGGVNEISGLTTNTGSLTLSRNETATVALTNAGTVNLLAGTLQATKFTQTAGTTTIASGATLKAGPSGTAAVAINGGLLTGNGQVSGVLTNAGTIEPARGVTPMTDSATFAQSSPGTLMIPIAGSTTPGSDFGQLKVTGVATLGGALTVVSAPGYLPAVGTTFTILTASSVTGTFSSLSGSLLSDRGYGVSYTSTAVILTVVPAPTVTGVVPAAGPLGGGTVVIVSGTNLTGATVKFGTTAATAVTVNGAGTSLTATSPADGAATVDVTVTTPGGTSTTSTSDRFTYVPAPTITGVAPAAGPLGGGTVVTVTGTNLTNSTVAFGTKAATGVTINGTGTSLTATSPAEAAATVDVTATTAGGTSATSSADLFTFVPAPIISGISPKAGPLSGGTIVTVTGTNLANSTVTFGTKAATGVSVNAAGTSLTATSPAGAGTVDIKATTVGGTSATSAADKFTYVPKPTVTGITPTAGPLGGGTVVTVTGTNLANSTVTFATTAATGVTVNAAGTSLTATSPVGSGIVDVKATTPGGTSATSAADKFTYVPAPTVSKVAPGSGPIAGGTVVTVTGTHLASSTVTFATAAATGVTVNAAGTSLTATSPAGSGTVDIKATTAGGTSATTAADHFTYLGHPAVSAISPSSGSVVGGTVVTVSGTNLAGVTTVHFGTKPATSVTVNAPGTALTATAPAGTGTIDVTVINPIGTSATSAADKFTYVPPTVSIGAVTQAEGTGGNTQMSFPVSLSGPSPATVTVQYATSNGTATAPGDYTAAFGTVTFTAGQTTSSIPVTIVGDQAIESDEGFSVTLSGPSNATLATSTATGTILNDDQPGTLTANFPESNTRAVTKTYGLTSSNCGSACTNLCAQAGAICPLSDGSNGAVTWTLTGQSFASSKLGFVWGPTPNQNTSTNAEFTITTSAGQHIPPSPITITYVATRVDKGVTVAYNSCTVTISITVS